jgi:hypothetical protein
VQPLEPVTEQEQYLVRYVPQQRHRAPTNWHRLWLRAAQGLAPAPLLCVPGWLARAAVFVGQPLDPALRPDNLRMLMAGYCGSPREGADLLGRAPAAPADARLLAALKTPRSPA